MLEYVVKLLGCLGRLELFRSNPGSEDGLAVSKGDDRGDGSANSSANSPKSPNFPLSIEQMTDLNAKFEHFLAELDLNADKRAILLGLEPDKKWMLLWEDSNRQDQRSNVTPEYYIAFLTNLTKDTRNAMPIDALRLTAEKLEGLKIALRTKPNSFVQKFLDLGGCALVLGILEQARVRCDCPPLEIELLGCMKALLNNSHGRVHVLEHAATVQTVALCFLSHSARTKTMVVEILAAITMTDNGHAKVLDAMTYMKDCVGERLRFQRVVFALGEQHTDEREDLALKTAIMSFLNVLLKCGCAQDLDQRLSLRWEFLALGVQVIIDELRSFDCPNLENHLDLFEMMRQEDEEEHARRCEVAHVDTSSNAIVFQVLEERLKYADAGLTMNSLLRHMLLLPVGRLGANCWALLDHVCQQLNAYVQHEVPADTASFDVQAALQQVADAQELEKALERIQQLEIQLRDSAHLSGPGIHRAANSVQDLGVIMNDGMVQQEKPFSIDDLLLGAENDPPLSLPRSGAAYVAPPPAPPLPPPLPALGSSVTPHIPKRAIPKPSAQLKVFNWTRIPDEQLPGTIWAELNEEKLYHQLDLEDIERKFAISAKCEEDGPDFDMGTLQRSSRCLNVIDSRRSQNLNILLSKYKLKNAQVLQAIQSMDTDSLLPKDMVEQLLKFLPSPEEVVALNDYRDHANQLAKSERFLLEATSKMPRYEQRLQCLYYKKKFQDRVAELKPKLEVVLKASTVMVNSKRLRKLLEVVLAYGNFMNYGRKAKEAGGFQLSALAGLAETRSSVNKDYTLMHHLVQTAEQRFPELLRLRRELGFLPEASKINMSDIQNELRQLRGGIALIAEEVRALKGDKEDLETFCPIMVEFVRQADPKVRALELLSTEMTTAFHKCVQRFGADPEKSSPDEFFSPLAQFFTAFGQIYRQLQTQREEEERRQKTLSRVPQRTNSKLSHTQSDKAGPQDWRSELQFMRLRKQGHAAASPVGDFDQLISALQSGEIFSEDLTRLRSSFKRHSTRHRSGTLGSPSNCIGEKSRKLRGGHGRESRGLDTSRER